MATMRPTAAHPLGQLRQELDRIFGDLTRSIPLAGGGAVGRGFPALNAWETDHDVYVEAELPGVREDQLELFVVGDELTIKGSRDEPTLEDSVYHLRERAGGNFSRTLRLPVDIDADKVEASLRSGVLEIKLPKAEAAKPRKIEVRAK